MKSKKIEKLQTEIERLQNEIKAEKARRRELNQRIAAQKAPKELFNISDKN